jgi:DNA polymerase I-like protein with 3'-5' exonuclease and polymerase domains
LKVYAIDIETTGLDFYNDRILGLGFYGGPKDKGYITDPELAKNWLTAHGGDFLVLQNGQFDVRFLAVQWDVPLLKIGWDTELAGWLILPLTESLSLENQYSLLVSPVRYKDESFITTLADKPVEEQAAYCLMDCELTYKLFFKQRELLKTIGNYTFMMKYFMPMYNFVISMGDRGMAADREAFEKERDNYAVEVARKINALDAAYRKDVHEYELARAVKKTEKNKTPAAPERLEELTSHKACKFNWQAAPQLKWLLIKKLKIFSEAESKENKKKTSSVAKEVLERYKDRHPIIQELLAMHKSATLQAQCEQYLETIQADGRIHPTFRMTVTDTGRTSCKGPNIQNPDKGKAMRDCFIARPGYQIVAADMSMIEPRLMAHYSKDRVLLKTFREDLDFYGIVVNAAMNMGLHDDGEIFKKAVFKSRFPAQRADGKVLGLSIAYGLGPPSLALRLADKTGKTYTFAQARQIIDDFNKHFPDIMTLRRMASEQIKQTGRITGILGRKVWCSYERALHNGINILIQGSASDFTLLTQLWVEKEKIKLNLDAEIVNFNHDEGVWEVREDHVAPFKRLLHAVMVNGWKKYAPELKLEVPLDCEIFVGPTWGCKAA